MTDRELLQQALDAIKHLCLHSAAIKGYDGEQVQTAIDVLKARLAPFEPEPEKSQDKPCVEDDGCPTEKAVLQRFWREHQAQPEQEPVAWLCMNKKSKSLFALTQEQLNELGYGNISMPPFEKVAPLYAHNPAKKLWLWKNFVDGRPEYWAFNNPYPTNLDDGDPQTLGQPCGYAIFKASRDGSCGRTEEQVLREMKNVAPPKRKWVGLTDDDLTFWGHELGWGELGMGVLRAVDAHLREKNNG